MMWRALMCMLVLDTVEHDCIVYQFVIPTPFEEFGAVGVPLCMN